MDPSGAPTRNCKRASHALTRDAGQSIFATMIVNTFDEVHAIQLPLALAADSRPADLPEGGYRSVDAMAAVAQQDVA